MTVYFSISRTMSPASLSSLNRRAGGFTSYMSARYNTAQMKHIQVRALACVAVVILALCSSGWGMDMRVIGDQVILTGPMSGFEVTQFMSSLTRAVTTVVFHNSGGGDFDAGLNLAAMIRQRGLTTVAQGSCISSCANAFLGGVRRYLADHQSYVAFHGHYKYSAPMQSRIGEMRNFYADMTDGKVSDELVLLWMRKPRPGMIYFFKPQTYSCNGTEVRRPRDCEKLLQKAMDQGIITALDDVKINSTEVRGPTVTDKETP